MRLPDAKLISSCSLAMARPQAPLCCRWRRPEMIVAFWPSPTRQGHQCNSLCYHPRGAARLPHRSTLLCNIRDDRNSSTNKGGRRDQDFPALIFWKDHFFLKAIEGKYPAGDCCFFPEIRSVNAGGMRKKQRCCSDRASMLSMKWRPGLAVITRTEHWEQAAQHLWGLSESDMAAYATTSPSENLHPADDARKLRTFRSEQVPARRAATGGT